MNLLAFASISTRIGGALMVIWIGLLYHCSINRCGKPKTVFRYMKMVYRYIQQKGTLAFCQRAF
ncbi:MAG: 2-hydroxycarboxylate transporter family protein [Clostridium sp.]